MEHVGLARLPSSALRLREESRRRANLLLVFALGVHRYSGRRPF